MEGPGRRGGTPPRRPSDSYRGATAIGGQNCSGEVARLVRSEEGDDLGDLFDLGAPSEQRCLPELLDEGCPLWRAEHRPRRYGVDPDAPRAELGRPRAGQ